MKAFGLVVSEKKIFFYVFLIVSYWEVMTPGVGPIWIPGAWLAGFIQRTTTHCYIQNMKALGLPVSEKKLVLCFSHDAPGAGPVWTSGARLAGFKKRTTIHCYIQNMKALGLVVSGEEEFLCFSHDAPGAGPFFYPGWQNFKEDHNTLLHTKYESSGPCSFGEEDFFMFSYCKSMGVICCHGNQSSDPTWPKT